MLAGGIVKCGELTGDPSLGAVLLLAAGVQSASLCANTPKHQRSAIDVLTKHAEVLISIPMEAKNPIA